MREQQRTRERESHEGEPLFRTLIEAAPTALILVGADGRLLLANQRTEEFFGYTHAELIGLPVERLIPERFRAAHARHLASFFQAPSRRAMGVDRHLSGLRKDGTEFPVAVGLSPIPTENGYQVVAVIEDITERKRAELALADIEARFRSFMDNLPAAAFIRDRSHRVLYGNRAWQESFGPHDADWFGRADVEFWPVDVAERLRAHDEVVLAERRVIESVQTVPTRDGVSREWRVFKFPLNQSGREDLIGGIAIDLTEQLAQEQAVRDSEERLRRAVIEAPFPMLIHAEGGEIIHVSRAWSELSGYGREQLRTAGDWARLAYPGREQAALQAIQRLYDIESTVDEGKHVICAAGGTLRTWMFRTSPLGRLHDGRRLLISMAADITDQERLQTELREQAARLKRSNADLEQFAYVASHDLQEPLRAVSGFCQLLELEYMDKLDADGREYVGQAVEGARRMQALIQDLLEFSRVERKGQPFQRVDFHSIVEDALQLLATALEESQARVHVEPLPTLVVDRGQFVRVMQNLIGNAIKFRRGGGPEITMSARRSGEEWIIAVRDNGIGIAPEFQHRIFTIFQRLHTRDEFPGTGIGLAVCKRIVERHGGRIWVESQAGQGSTFFLALPIDPITTGTRPWSQEQDFGLAGNVVT